MACRRRRRTSRLPPSSKCTSTACGTWSGATSSRHSHHYAYKLGTSTPTWRREPWASGGATDATTSLLYKSAKAHVMTAVSKQKRLLMHSLGTAWDHY